METKGGHPVADLIKSYGYSVEIYDKIETEDHYIITLYRIPHGRDNTTAKSAKKPSVLLMHGAISSSFDFMVTGPTRALGFLLSELGYDVWIGNYRGSKVSRNHVHLNSENDEQYWKFSFHEISIYDLPAILNHIELVTGNKTVTYIGYSLGTVLPLVLISEQPEFNKRFNLIIAVAPVLVLNPMSSIPYQILQATRHIWLVAMEKSGNLQIPPKFMSSWITFIKNKTKTSMWWKKLIAHVLFCINGWSPNQLNIDDIPLICDHYPDTTSAIVMKHCFQPYRTGTFIKLDHGIRRNLELYGTPDAPAYNIHNVICPVALYSFSADIVSHPKDVRTLSWQLPNCVDLVEFKDVLFNHSDFIYGKDAAKIIYPSIFNHLKKYARAH